MPNTLELFQNILAQVREDPLKLATLAAEMNTYGFSEKQLHEIYLTAVKLKVEAIQYIPIDERSEDICLTAVQQNWEAIGLVQKDMLKLYGEISEDKLKFNENLVITAIKQNYKAIDIVIEISNIDPQNLSYNIMFELIKQKGSLVNFVKPEFRDFKMCMAAVKQDGLSLKHLQNFENNIVLKETELKEICRAAVEENPFAIEFVPPKNRELALYRQALEKNWRVARLIPDEVLMASPKIISEIQEALKQNWRDIENVPAKLFDTNLFQEAIQHSYAAVRENWQNLRALPERIRSPEICLEAVQQNANAFTLISPQMRTYKICEEAVNKDKWILRNILDPDFGTALSLPEKEALALMVIKENPSFLKMIPENMLTYTVCLEAIKKDPYLIECLKREKDRQCLSPEEYIELCAIALSEDPYLSKDDFDKEVFSKNEINIYHGMVKQNGKNLRHVPEEKRNYVICRAAIENDPNALQYIEKPQDRPTLSLDEYKDIALPAVKKNPQFFKYLGSELITYELSFAAISSDPHLLRSIKQKHSSLNPIEYKKLCMLAVQKNGLRLSDVDRTFLDHELCLTAVKQNWYVLDAVPVKLRNKEICLAAIEKDTDALKFLKNPEDRTELTKEVYLEICLSAIKKDAFALKNIPGSMRSYAICQEAINQRPSLIEYLKNPEDRLRLKPEEFQKLCYEAVEKDPHTIRYIPKENITYSMCLSAIEKDPGILRVLPKLKDMDPRNLSKEEYKKLCTLALEKSLYNIDYVDESVLDYEMCLNAVKKNGSILRYVPAKYCDKDLCLTAIESDPSAIEDLQKPEIREKLTMEDYELICKTALQRDGRALKYIPEDKREYETCLIAVKNNPEALADVPIKWRNEEICLEAIKRYSRIFYREPEEEDRILKILQPIEIKSVLTPEQFKTICRTALDYNGFAIKDIPQNLLTQPMCLAAVKTTGQAIEYVPIKMRTHEVCVAAIRQNPKALEKLKEFATSSKLDHKQYKALCVEACQKDFTLMEHVNPKFKSAVYLEIFKHNGMALRELQQSIERVGLKGVGLTEKEYKELCVAAIKQEAMALEFVSEDIKPEVIKTISPEKILYMNYKVKQFFPKEPDFTPAINQFLAEIRHVVITKVGSFSGDHEIKDVFLKYAHKPKCSGKTIHVEKDQAQALFDDIKNVKKGDHPINLVLVGHAGPQSDSLGGMDVNEIKNSLEKNEFIERVTLMGCQTVQAEKLEEEKALIANYKEEEKTPTPFQSSGLIVLSRTTDSKEYFKLLKMVSSKDKNLDRTYVLTKSGAEGEERYELLYLQKDPNEKIIERRYPLDEEEALSLLKKFKTDKGKLFSFPDNATEILCIRGGASRSVNVEEMQHINNTISTLNIYDREHPDYSKTKQISPHLRNFVIDANEEAKLADSLLKKVYEAIKHIENKKIKGYPDLLSVDTKKGMMRTTEGGIYSDAYKSDNVSTFFTKKGSIDAVKLNKEMEKRKDDLKKKQGGPTRAKSITIETSKKLNKK